MAFINVEAPKTAFASSPHFICSGLLASTYQFGVMTKSCANSEPGMGATRVSSSRPAGSNSRKVSVVVLPILMLHVTSRSSATSCFMCASVACPASAPSKVSSPSVSSVFGSTA